MLIVEPRMVIIFEHTIQSLLSNKPNQPPIKYKCTIKIRNWIRHVYLVGFHTNKRNLKLTGWHLSVFLHWIAAYSINSHKTIRNLLKSWTSTRYLSNSTSSSGTKLMQQWVSSIHWQWKVVTARSIETLYAYFLKVLGFLFSVFGFRHEECHMLRNY